MKLAAPVRHGRTPARLARPFRAGATSRRSIGVIWLSAVRKGWIAGSSWPFEDHRQYPVEVLNRAADIFRMAGLSFHHEACSARSAWPHPGKACPPASARRHIAVANQLHLAAISPERVEL